MANSNNSNNDYIMESMENPHEEQQRTLLHRIVLNIIKLNDALEDVNDRTQTIGAADTFDLFAHFVERGKAITTNYDRDLASKDEEIKRLNEENKSLKEQIDKLNKENTRLLCNNSDNKTLDNLDDNKLRLVEAILKSVDEHFLEENNTHSYNWSSSAASTSNSNNNNISSSSEDESTGTNSSISSNNTTLYQPHHIPFEIESNISNIITNETSTLNVIKPFEHNFNNTTPNQPIMPVVPNMIIPSLPMYHHHQQPLQYITNPNNTNTNNTINTANIRQINYNVNNNNFHTRQKNNNNYNNNNHNNNNNNDQYTVFISWTGSTTMEELRGLFDTDDIVDVRHTQGKQFAHVDLKTSEALQKAMLLNSTIKNVTQGTLRVEPGKPRNYSFILSE
ncbi:12803_t:CDS:10 [Entrophospora sp. SA101]|nr:12798_t:CDS:10 [Entrophospora sp. SA101]CAJ0845846.1 12803_t:CDS:10 [Entrophospora sp. SA101]